MALSTRTTQRCPPRRSFASPASSVRLRVKVRQTRVCSFRREGEVIISIPSGPDDVVFKEEDALPPSSLTPIFLVSGVSILAIVAVMSRVFRPARTTEKVPVEAFEVAPAPQHDPQAYTRALARSRQSCCIQKAVAFMKGGSTARAMVELVKALNENNIARSQYVCTHTTPVDLLELYRMHIQNTEFPPNFATLLQLREMLGIAKDQADLLEKEALQTPSAFSI